MNSKKSKQLRQYLRNEENVYPHQTSYNAFKDYGKGDPVSDPSLIKEDRVVLSRDCGRKMYKTMKKEYLKFRRKGILYPSYIIG